MNKKASRTKLDMTHGPIMKLVVLFAIPMVIGNILQQLYSTADTFIIGNFCGSASIASVCLYGNRNGCLHPDLHPHGRGR